MDPSQQQGEALAKAARQMAFQETATWLAEARAAGETVPPLGSQEERDEIERDVALRSTREWLGMFLGLEPQPSPLDSWASLSLPEQFALILLNPPDLGEFSGQVNIVASSPPLNATFVHDWDCDSIALSGQHLGGHEQLSIGEVIQLHFTPNEMFVRRAGREGEVGVPFSELRDLSIESPEQVESRVTLPRAASLGLLSLAFKKTLAKSYLVFETQWGGAIIFEVEGYTAMQLRGLLAPLLQHLTRQLTA